MEKEIKERLKQGIAADKFVKRFGLFGSTTIGVAALMGGGVYVLIGIAADNAGPSVCLSFLLCGCLAYLTTMVFAELSSKKTVIGGGYAYAYSSLGSVGGFSTGWFLALGSVFACSLYALGFANYFSTFIANDMSELFVKLMGSGIILSLVLVSALVSESNKIQAFLTWGNVAILLTLCIAGAFSADPSQLENPFPKGFSGTIAAISVIYISFFGYQLIANNSTEIRSAKETVPKSMKYSMMIACTLYVLVALVAVITLPWKQLASSDAPLTLVAEKVFGGTGWIIISMGGVLASAGALNSTLFSQGRQIYAMGKHRFFPDVLGQLSATSKTPMPAIISGGAGAILALWILDLEFIAKSANFCLLAAMIPISLSLRKLYHSGEVELPAKVWRRFLPELALAANIAMMLSLDWVSLVFGQQLALAGAVIFFFYSRKREKRSKNAYHVVLSDKRKNTLPLLGGGNKLLLPMANPESQEALFNIAHTMLSFNGGEIIGLSIAKTPEDKDMVEAMNWAKHSIEIIRRSTGLAHDANIHITPIIRAAKDISMGIVHAAEEENCNLIVMGYKPDDQNSDSGIMRNVLNHTKSDVIFLSAQNSSIPFNPSRIAVSLAGRINLDLMATLAGSLSGYYKSHISFLSILPEKFHSAHRLRADRILIEAIQKLSVNTLYDASLLKSADPLQTLIRHSSDYDLLIVGATKSKLWGSNSIGSFSEQLALHAKCDVAIVRSLPVYRKMLRVI
ncbi:MAG: amino acid permease [Flavobacteriales bacterium]